MRAAGKAFRTVAALAAATVLWGTPERAAGQQAGGGDLASVADDFARAWQAGRIDAVAARMPADGILLHLPEAVHPVLDHRLARAALADFHGRAGRGGVSVRQSRALGGEPPRAFLEMAWAPVPPGVSEALEYTVFAGLEERDGVWWVVEIRVLSPGGPRASSVPARKSAPSAPAGEEDRANERDQR